MLYTGVRGCSGVQWDRLTEHEPLVSSLHSPTNKPTHTGRNCSIRCFPARLSSADQNQLRKQLIWRRCCFGFTRPRLLFIPQTALMFRWAPLRRSLIIIHIFSFLCQLRELTPPVFVQALKGAALIIRVRDGTMAFSWNCPPTRVVFDSFSWHVPRKCTQYVNECDTQTIIRLGDSDVCCETSCH